MIPVDPRAVNWFAMLSITVGSLLLVACGSSSPPAAVANEVFGRGSIDAPDPGAGIDDRWAVIVIDEVQEAEVNRILEEMAAGPVAALVRAPHGIRFEDAPRAMLTAVPRLDMAILNSRRDPATVSAEYFDSRGRRATASILLRERGPIAQVDYRVPGEDVTRSRSLQLLDLERRLQSTAVPVGATLSERSAEAILRSSIRSNRGTMISTGSEPERLRFRLLMLDEQEATVVVRREPEPAMLSMTVEAGLFGSDVEGERAIRKAFVDSLRAWGQVLQPSAAVAPPDPCDVTRDSVDEK